MERADAQSLDVRMTSFEITVTAEVAATMASPAIPILTAKLTPFLAKGTTTGDWFPMYFRGQPSPLTLSCTSDEANRDCHDDDAGNMWKIVAENFDPIFPLFRTTIKFDIVTDHTIRIVITPAPQQIF